MSKENRTPPTDLSRKENRRELALVYLQAGEESFAEGEYEDALDNFDQAVANDSSQEAAWFGRANLYLQFEEYEKVEKEVNQMMTLFPKNADVYALRGNLFRCRGDVSRSLKEFDHALELSSQCHLAWYGRGIAKDILGDLPGAMADFDQCLIVAPTFVPGWYDRGVLLTTEGQLEKAIDDYSKAIEIDPSFTQAYITRGDLYSILGNIDNAIKDFDEAIKIDPENADAWYYRAMVWEESGDTFKAKKDYQRAMELGFTEE